MLSVEDRYYNINRIMLKISGLWPYRTSKWSYIQLVTVTAMLSSAIFAQLAVFITHECTMDLIINVLSFVFPTIFMLAMYHFYYFCSDEFKAIMEHIYYDWRSLKNKEELDIMHNHAFVTKILTEISIFFLIIGEFATVSTHAIPIIMNTMLPPNESIPLALHIKAEYFADPSKHLYLFMAHLTAFLCVGMFTSATIALTLFHYTIHAAAVFKIANYRMSMVMNKDVLRIPSPERKKIIIERLVNFINCHRRNILFCDTLIVQLNTPMLILMITGVASTSICMFRMLQAIIAHNDIVEVFISLSLTFCHFCFLFFGNAIGQIITNNNAEIFDTVYNLKWYLVSLDIQKLILFLLRKGNKNYFLTVGGVFDASYEGFTTLITSSISYFTVIYAIQ